MFYVSLKAGLAETYSWPDLENLIAEGKIAFQEDRVAETSDDEDSSEGEEQCRYISPASSATY
jgi:hypothetical protein